MRPFVIVFSAIARAQSLSRAKHVINRVGDQDVGFWEANLQDIAHPSRIYRAERLVYYLGLSEALRRMRGEKQPPAWRLMAYGVDHGNSRLPTMRISSCLRSIRRSRRKSFPFT